MSHKENPKPEAGISKENLIPSLLTDEGHVIGGVIGATAREAAAWVAEDSKGDGPHEYPFNPENWKGTYGSLDSGPLDRGPLLSWPPVTEIDGTPIETDEDMEDE